MGQPSHSRAVQWQWQPRSEQRHYPPTIRSTSGTIIIEIRDHIIRLEYIGCQNSSSAEASSVYYVSCLSISFPVISMSYMLFQCPEKYKIAVNKNGRRVADVAVSFARRTNWTNHCNGVPFINVNCSVEPPQNSMWSLSRRDSSLPDRMTCRASIIEDHVEAWKRDLSPLRFLRMCQETWWTVIISIEIEK